MADKPSVESDKLSAVETIREEMRAKVHRLAWPAEPGESVKACIRRVSRATGLSFGQIRALWYGEWKRVPADVADTIRKFEEAHARGIHARIVEERKRQERLWALSHHSSDPEFYSGQPGLDSDEADGRG